MNQNNTMRLFETMFVFIALRMATY